MEGHELTTLEDFHDSSNLNWKERFSCGENDRFVLYQGTNKI